MFVETIKSKQKGKEYFCHLLRQNYRENGKVKHRTVANLSSCSEAEIKAIKIALKFKDKLSQLELSDSKISLKQGLSVGAVWLISQIAKKNGITQSLGSDREGNLALWQIIARIIDQGSRLSAVRLARTHAACDTLNIKKTFNEDHLYNNLDWLADNQTDIEKNLFKHRHKNNIPNIFLYDVTSSYLEGTKNFFADWGYNRDKKKGKMQIVIGLLCDSDGFPVSIEVFKGNERDFDTFHSQVKKVADRFGCKRVTLVGDRGMIKSAQVENIKDNKFYYVTAITKPQIEKMINTGLIQLDLFDKKLFEVTVEKEDDKVERYLLRKNPTRALEIVATRESKLSSLQKLVNKKNKYLEEHSRAKVEVAEKNIALKMHKLKVNKWLNLKIEKRHFFLEKDESALEKISRLDGCYVIKSNVPMEVSDGKLLHDRYKDLAFVEHAFRTIKTDFLEIRPVNVRTENHTKGHALIAMLSYAIIYELNRLWSDFNITVEEGIRSLDRICSTFILRDGKVQCQQIPEPNDLNGELLKAADIVLPEVLPGKGINVSSRHKLKRSR